MDMGHIDAPGVEAPVDLGMPGKRKKKSAQETLAAKVKVLAGALKAVKDPVGKFAKKQQRCAVKAGEKAEQALLVGPRLSVRRSRQFLLCVAGVHGGYEGASQSP